MAGTMAGTEAAGAAKAVAGTAAAAREAVSSTAGARRRGEVSWGAPGDEVVYMETRAENTEPAPKQKYAVETLDWGNVEPHKCGRDADAPDGEVLTIQTLPELGA